MAFQKTIDLWTPGVQEALLDGSLTLQPGQWVKCGPGHAGRYVGITRGRTICVAHWQGSAAKTLMRYHDLRSLFMPKEVA